MHMCWCSARGLFDFICIFPMYILRVLKNLWCNSNFWVCHKSPGFKHFWKHRVIENYRENKSVFISENHGLSHGWCGRLYLWLIWEDQGLPDWLHHRLGGRGSVGFGQIWRPSQVYDCPRLRCFLASLSFCWTDPWRLRRKSSSLLTVTSTQILYLRREKHISLLTSPSFQICSVTQEEIGWPPAAVPFNVTVTSERGEEVDLETTKQM